MRKRRVLADYKFNVLDRVVDRYFVNARRIRELCDQRVFGVAA